MTDAGEKLADRWRTWPLVDNLARNKDMVEFCRAQLERAAEIADRMAASSQKDADSTPDQAPISKEAFRIQAKGCWAIATAIRKLKE